MGRQPTCAIFQIAAERCPGGTSDTNPAIYRWVRGWNSIVETSLQGSGNDFSQLPDEDEVARLAFDAWMERAYGVKGLAKCANVRYNPEGAHGDVCGSMDLSSENVLLRTAECLRLQLAQRALDRELGIGFPHKAWSRFCQVARWGTTVARTGKDSLAVVGGTYTGAMPLWKCIASVTFMLTVVIVAVVQAADITQVAVREYNCRTIYHSPQTPGYTCWAGIWKMPDASVMIAFTQVTGPLQGWRQRAPREILQRLPTAQQDIPAYDMTGLVQENLHLRSTDNGETWTRFSSDTFSSAMNGYSEGSVVVLDDGGLLRAGWGQSLTYCDVRPTGFLQRSTDGAKSWGAPEYLSQDTHLQTFPTRIRRLRDGRLLVTGGAAAFDPLNWQWMNQLPVTRHCLWINNDPSGKSWSEPLYVTPGADFACEEWDAAELENGDLLAVFRAITYDESGTAVKQDRRQAILARQADTWVPGPILPTPFPHDGHPELLRTQEGIILHIAPTAFSWTADRGQSWTKLDCPGTGYYPHAAQLEDGTILVVGHTGNDDPYGKTDQAITLVRLRLDVR